MSQRYVQSFYQLISAWCLLTLDGQVGTSNHLNPTELRRAIGNIWRPDVKDDQTARQVTDAPNATSGDVWEDDKLSTTEDDTLQPDHSTKMDIPTSSGYNKLSTTEGGSPDPTQLAANDPVNPDVPAAGITNPNGPIKDPQPPVIPWPVDHPPIPIYTLSSPPPPSSQLYPGGFSKGLPHLGQQPAPANDPPTPPDQSMDSFQEI
jgi:hypothetical protein